MGALSHKIREAFNGGRLNLFNCSFRKCSNGSEKTSLPCSVARPSSTGTLERVWTRWSSQRLVGGAHGCGWAGREKDRVHRG